MTFALTLMTAFAGITFSTDTTTPTPSGTTDIGGIQVTFEANDAPDAEPALPASMELAPGISFSIPADGLLTRDQTDALDRKVSVASYVLHRPFGIAPTVPQGPVGDASRVRTWGTGDTAPSATNDARWQAVDWCRMHNAYDSYPVRVTTVYDRELPNGERMKTVDWTCTAGSAIESRSAHPILGVGATASIARRAAHARADGHCGGDQYPIWRGVQSHTINEHGEHEVWHLFNCSPQTRKIEGPHHWTAPPTSYDVETEPEPEENPPVPLPGFEPQDFPTGGTIWVPEDDTGNDYFEGVYWLTCAINANCESLVPDCELDAFCDTNEHTSGLPGTDYGEIDFD
ncbi:MAG: hypothetical protein H6734_10095 [Alphaproteobacteria bacterium]|nr:hypothetical protein [Alphaproteobacteria bacterium]